jgi:hypothetical protein
MEIQRTSNGHRPKRQSKTSWLVNVEVLFLQFFASFVQAGKQRARGDAHVAQFVDDVPAVAHRQSIAQKYFFVAVSLDLMYVSMSLTFVTVEAAFRRPVSAFHRALRFQLKFAAAIRTEGYLNCVICNGNFPVFSVFENEAGASLIYHPKNTQPHFLVGLRN